MKTFLVAAALVFASFHASAQVMPANGKTYVPPGGTQLYPAFFGDSITFGSVATHTCTSQVPNQTSGSYTQHTIAGMASGPPSNNSTWIYDCLLAEWLDSVGGIGSPSPAIPATMFGNTGNGAGVGAYTNLAKPSNGVKYAIALAAGTTPATFAMPSNVTVAFGAFGINDSNNVQVFNGQAGNTYCAGCTPHAASLQFIADLNTWIAAVQTAAPSAKIILFTIPNQAYLQGTGSGTIANSGIGITHTADAFSRCFNADIRALGAAQPNNTTTFEVVDLACNAGRYNAVNQNGYNAGNPSAPTASGIHPNNAGHQDQANFIENTMVTYVTGSNGTLPASSCSMTPTGFPGTDGNGVSIGGSTFDPVTTTVTGLAC